jgi:hypothetical protein
MPRDKTVTVYRLPELEGRARERALTKLAEWATQGEWYEPTLDDAKRMGAILGITADDISFSGFWSQGDGASFVGSYTYAKGAAKAIRREAPEDTVLHGIADTLQAIGRRNGYRLTASVSRRSHHYSHPNTVTVETDGARVESDAGDRGELADALRAFMTWVYRQLESEYEYQTSEPALLEMADANEYEFTASGEVA